MTAGKEQRVATSRIENISIHSGLFHRIRRLVKEEVLPYQWDVLNDRVDVVADTSIIGDDITQEFPSHCIANFRIAAGEEEGDFYGMVFQDTDLYKWIEAASYVLMSDPDPELEKQIDDVVDLIGRAQQEDGYINTYFQIQEPDKKWTNLLECHELYTAGHMIEAAVAYYQATGKTAFLKVAEKMVDCIDGVLGLESEGKIPGYPGHQEIELALLRLYEVTGNEKHLKLAKFFIDERGKEPMYFDIEFEKRNRESFFGHFFPPHGFYSYGRKYAQYHKPIREQDAFYGHSVRCMYMASSAVDLARLTGDEELLEACKTMYNNLMQRRMYITGGIGSARKGERFTYDYDLPNDTLYSETCASIGLMFFMQRMLLVEQNARYADTMERALYNTCNAGMSLDGKGFFYVNPLEADPTLSRENPTRAHVLTERPGWFACACCPPNYARMIASLPQYLYITKGNEIFVNLYTANKAKLELDKGEVSFEVATDYPYEGSIRFRVLSAGEYAFNLRIPDWSRGKWSIKINDRAENFEVVDGYARAARPWNEGDIIELLLDVTPTRVYSNPKVASNVGKVAIQRGPLVYCLEEVDNGSGLQQVYLPKGAELKSVKVPNKLGGTVEVRATGLRLKSGEPDTLYSYAEAPLEFEEVELTFIPYYLWANRGENEMTVWVHEKA